MTNREYINQLSDDDLTEWLCKQMWPYYGEEGALDAIRFHQVRNFLKMEYRADQERFGGTDEQGTGERSAGMV